MIYCSNCGTSMPDDALFCPECGTKTEKTISTEITSSVQASQDIHQARPANPPSAQPNQPSKNLQHFLQVSLPSLTKKILFDPLDGTKKILIEIKEPAKIGLYCILVCSLIISLLIYIRIPSEWRRGMDFFEYFFRAFTLPIIGAFIITFFSFIVKAINNSKQVTFGNEILTGGFVSIGYAVFFLLAFLLSYILEGSFNSSPKINYGFYEQRVNSGPPVFPLIIIFSVFIYLFTITSNSLSQSLRSSGIKDGTAFYLSPFLVIISAYLTIRLWIALFGGNYGLGFNNIFNSL